MEAVRRRSWNVAFSRVAMLLKEEEDAEGCGGAEDNACTGHSSCINAISRNEKRKDEAAEDLGTCGTGRRQTSRLGARHR